jgi:hypothetical protein
MPRALVISESMYGNTQQVAEAIAEGLAEVAAVDAVEVGSAPTNVPATLDLIVVGGPTHAFGMSRPRTREDAAKQGHAPLISQGIGVREWLDSLQPIRGVPAAAFDTHVEHPKLLRHVGSAAGSIAKRLHGLGFERTVAPEHFWVSGTEGPLGDGELERAREWGRTLAEKARLASLPTLA